MSDDGDNGDDIGPMLPSAVEELPKKKKRKGRFLDQDWPVLIKVVIPHEALYLSHLPNSEKYTKSFMHRDDLFDVCVAPFTDYVITASVDGYVKFWKKHALGIEFVKQYRAHIETIVATSFGQDGLWYATASSDNTIKVFDINNFDMINVIELDFVPKALCWLYKKGSHRNFLAVTNANSNTFHVYDARSNDGPLHQNSTIHRQPVSLVAYNSVYDCTLSFDITGMIEYWQVKDEIQAPSITDLWGLKSSTDLYVFKKNKSICTSVAISPQGDTFATFSSPDRQLRLFSFLTGKIIRVFDESIATIMEMQQCGTAISILENIEFGRRISLERELEKNSSTEGASSILFDETGNFIIYASYLGIKVINRKSNKCVRLLGRDEQIRFVKLALYQGAPKQIRNLTAAMAASDNPLLSEAREVDPTIFATAFRKSRFYLFTVRHQNEEGKGDRDVYNEKADREVDDAADITAPERKIANSAVIHTTIGDISLQLYPDMAPKAVENFVTHSMNSYFDKTNFHRVIPKFMIQGGDPLGDGTGGESIWGKEFEDEFSNLKHDKPYTLSMANAGPNTNGSQFFITTEATPWLDGKHTIFGRAVGGLDVIHRIENAKADSHDRPLKPVSIVNIDVL